MIPPPDRGLGRAPRPSAPGLTAIGIFLVVGGVAALLAGTTLLVPGTPLDGIWRLNPIAHSRLKPMGPTIGLGFLVLSSALAAASLGWFRRRRWGWALATAIIAIQFAGDLTNLLSGDLLRGGAGILIASALLSYLFTARVRAAFS